MRTIILLSSLVVGFMFVTPAVLAAEECCSSKAPCRQGKTECCCARADKVSNKAAASKDTDGDKQCCKSPEACAEGGASRCK